MCKQVIVIVVGIFLSKKFGQFNKKQYLRSRYKKRNKVSHT